MPKKDQEFAQYAHTWPEAIRVILAEKERNALAAVEQYKEELDEIWKDSKQDHPLLRRFQKDARGRRQAAMAAAKAKAKEEKPKALKAKWLALAGALSLYDEVANSIMDLAAYFAKGKRSKEPTSQVEIELRRRIESYRWFNL
ncbi:hypothetical protein [Shimazuella alba]|uniref:Uncharacterized protein n=1 Tax=Shimazuella alba TaxID=2690964 RepID=A0A6I4VX45_9BACL|nr:hypothetical protein [Shimazuella alba]MXQ55423.1 hypothetical protein [Shimazuella alba]